MLDTNRTKFSILRLALLVLVSASAQGHFFNGENFEPNEVSSDISPPMILISDDAINMKRSNVNTFKNMMITKDNAELIVDDDVLKDRIYYIPRVASNNGKKRGAILSWALPANRMRVGNSNYRQPTNYGMANSRPAAK